MVTVKELTVTGKTTAVAVVVPVRTHTHTQPALLLLSSLFYYLRLGE